MWQAWALDLYVFQARCTLPASMWTAPWPLQLVQWGHWTFPSWTFNTRRAEWKTSCSMLWALPPMVSWCSQEMEKRLRWTRLAILAGKMWMRRKCVLYTAKKSSGESMLLMSSHLFSIIALAPTSSFLIAIPSHLGKINTSQMCSAACHHFPVIVQRVCFCLRHFHFIT